MAVMTLRTLQNRQDHRTEISRVLLIQNFTAPKLEEWPTHNRRHRSDQLCRVSARNARQVFRSFTVALADTGLPRMHWRAWIGALWTHTPPPSAKQRLDLRNHGGNHLVEHVVDLGTAERPNEDENHRQRHCRSKHLSQSPGEPTRQRRRQEIPR